MTTKKIAAILCMIVILVNSFPALAMTTSDKEGIYNAAVQQLEVYLESYGNSSAELAGIAGSFAELRGYEQSTFLGYYVTALRKIADEEYDYELYTALNMLERNVEFNTYLKDALKGSSIGSVVELMNYAAAREYEHNGNDTQALESYGECLNFFDASKRYEALLLHDDQKKYDVAMNLLKTGDYAGAYYAFSEIPRFNDSKNLMASIISQLGYTPEFPNDNLLPAQFLYLKEVKNNQVTLTWLYSKHATNYAVYYKKIKNTDWNLYKNTNETEIIISNLEKNAVYDFKVVASNGKLTAESAVVYNVNLGKEYIFGFNCPVDELVGNDLAESIKQYIVNVNNDNLEHISVENCPFFPNGIMNYCNILNNVYSFHDYDRSQVKWSTDIEDFFVPDPNNYSSLYWLRYDNGDSIGSEDPIFIIDSSRTPSYDEMLSYDRYYHYLGRDDIGGLINCRFTKENDISFIWFEMVNKPLDYGISITYNYSTNKLRFDLGIEDYSLTLVYTFADTRLSLLDSYIEIP